MVRGIFAFLLAISCHSFANLVENGALLEQIEQGIPASTSYGEKQASLLNLRSDVDTVKNESLLEIRSQLNINPRCQPLRDAFFSLTANIIKDGKKLSWPNTPINQMESAQAFARIRIEVETNVAFVVVSQLQNPKLNCPYLGQPKLTAVLNKTALDLAKIKLMFVGQQGLKNIGQDYALLARKAAQYYTHERNWFIPKQIAMHIFSTNVISPIMVMVLGDTLMNIAGMVSIPLSIYQTYIEFNPEEYLKSTASIDDLLKCAEFVAKSNLLDMDELIDILLQSIDSTTNSLLRAKANLQVAAQL